ncbi:hypothetical protein DH2020_003971 [Rehmannia glutinosa]|uniref:BSD domain-containing protein n=1 Tax=Rehmannia glutinosa TaxID=99300 RepID=A0ABR0XN58_REHGL
MSWLARSIANSLRLDEEEEDAAAAAAEEKTLDDAVPRTTLDDAVPPEDRPRDSTFSAEDRRSSGSDGDITYNNSVDEDLNGDKNQGRGVKEDLSEFKDSLTRQLWGVASFLAPPPPPPPPPPLPFSQRSVSVHYELKSEASGSDNDDEVEGEEMMEHDERESGQFGELAYFSPSEDYYTIEDAIGITEEVLAFARNIAHHPETWLDFPLSEEEEFDDNRIRIGTFLIIPKGVICYGKVLLRPIVRLRLFRASLSLCLHWELEPLYFEKLQLELLASVIEAVIIYNFVISDAQYRHALAVEHLSPRLAALRIEFCPVHMSEGYFWMVYFVLLHSRLNKHDADLLSSPQFETALTQLAVLICVIDLQLVEARAMWMQELQKRTKEESYWLGLSTYHSKETTDSPRQNFTTHFDEDGRFGNVSEPISPAESSMHEIDKHPVNEIEFVDKSVIKEDPMPKLQEKEMILGSSVEKPVQDYDNDDDDDDDWLKDDSDLIGYSSTSIVVNEEDISFSDLEDDLDCTMPIKYKIASTEGNSTKKTP